MHMTLFFCGLLDQNTAMTLARRAAEIAEDFAFLEDWEERYAHIIDLGKANPALGASERTDVTKVRGCASQVWMVPGQDKSGRLLLRAESDAVLVSGLIAILIRLYSGATREEISSFDAAGYLNDIGVSGALSAQRSNGLASMVRRIQQYATTMPSEAPAA